MNKPGDLFEWSNERKARALARKTDHDSSHMAADAAERSGLVRSHESLVLSCLTEHRGVWLTAESIGLHTGLSSTQVRKRTQPLVDSGLIEKWKPEAKHIRWRVPAETRG
jgi:hypothetical protein